MNIASCNTKQNIFILIEDVRVKLSPGLLWRKHYSTRRNLNQQTGLKFKGETNEMLHLKNSIVCAETWIFRKVDQKYLEKFLTVMLGNSGDQLYYSCEK